MRRVYIIVEGQTEQEFVNDVIRPYLNDFGVYAVIPILIHTSKIGRGGFVNYQHLSNTIKPLLASKSNDFIVTTFVDFFRIPNNIPNYTNCISLPDREAQVDALEQAINNDINDSRFFSYIQLHEFEALLFTNNSGFEKYKEDNISLRTKEIVENYSNPEDINTTPEGAPSKRILAIDEQYNKVVDGNIIALEIGINDMLSRCPRLNTWVKNIITKATYPPLRGQCN
ncbi:MAG: DUF4276 family protein [bacterium]